MKKSSFVLCTCLALSGCMFGFDPDVDSAAETRAEHHDAYRQEFGCPLTDDHEAYRNCLINTYKGTHPKTFRTEIDENGKSVAIVKNETKTSYDKDTDTYKTERVIVIETEERLVPVPAALPPVPPPTTEEIKPIEPSPLPADEECCDEEVIDDVVEKTSAPVATQPKEPAKPKTWWDTYQQEKKPAEIPAKPVCPCEDPNDPCPQCVDK